MKIVLLLALAFTVLLWPLYRYANRPGQPSDDWSSAFLWFISLFLAGVCYAAWIVWALLAYLLR